MEDSLIISASVDDEKPASNKYVEESRQIATIDQFLDQIGQVGRFQVCVILCMSAMILVAGYQSLFIVFGFQAPPWKCTGINMHECNSTHLFNYGVPGFESRCHMNRSSWTYATPKTFSIVTDYDLVCSRKVLSVLADSAHFIGVILAGLPLAYASDVYGRKPVLMISFTGVCACSFFLGFSPNIGVVILFRVLTGGCICGMLMTISVLALELVGPKYRTFAGLVFWNAWTVGLCLLSVQSWFVHEWKVLAMVTSAPYLVFVLAFLFVPESVRWYQSQNRTNEAEAVLQKAAAVNGKDYPWNKCLSTVQDIREAKSSSYRVLFSSCKECLQTFALCWMWFTNDLNYYGIAIASGDFGGALHRDFVLFSICEIPGNLITIYILDKIGRKRSTLIGYVATSLSLISFGFMQHFDVKLMPLRVSLGIISKMFNILAWSATSVWSGELYPTHVRSQAVGLFIIVSQCGSFFSPWIAKWLKNYSVALPFFIFGGFPFVAGCLSLQLKETMGKSMDGEDVIHDPEDLIVASEQI